MGRAAAEGLIAGGVLPVIKHIPGHGRAKADSHLDLPIVDTSLAELDAWQVDPDNLAEDCLKLLAATEQMMESCDEVGQVLAVFTAKRWQLVAKLREVGPVTIGIIESTRSGRPWPGTSGR